MNYVIRLLYQKTKLLHVNLLKAWVSEEEVVVAYEEEWIWLANKVEPERKDKNATPFY